LEKLPADRFESAKAFAEALADPRFSVGSGAAAGVSDASGHDRWRLAAIAATAVAGTAIVLALWGWLRARAAVPRLGWQSSIALPDSAPLGLGFDLSRDGSVLVCAAGGGGNGMLRVRRAGDPSVVAIPGTQGGYQPAISPDGRRVAYLAADNWIEVVSLQGGAPTRVAYAPFILPLLWTDEEHVAFTTSRGRAVQVPVTGGAETVIGRPDTAADEGFVVARDVLPDHDGLLVMVVRRRNVFSLDSARIGVVTKAGGHPTIIMPGVWARYSRTGYLVVTRSDGSVIAVPFDPKSRTVTGPPTELASGVRPGFYTSAGLVAVTREGRVVYGASGRGRWDAELVRVTRSGGVTPIAPNWVRQFVWLAVSADGRRVAASVQTASQTGSGEQTGGGRDLLIRDLTTGSVARVALSGGDINDPTFMPGGRSVIFSAVSYSAPPAVYRVPSRGGTPEMIWRWSRGSAPASSNRSADTVATGRQTLENAAVSPDGRTLYVDQRSGVDGSWAVRVIPMDTVSTGAGRLINHAAAPQPSPDGRWLAYLSSAAGGVQVEVRSTDPSNDQEWQVSPSARPGSVVRWSRDGHELYYLAGDSMYAARVVPGPAFAVTSSRALFAAGRYRSDFGVTPDGDFIMIRPIPQAADVTELHMIDDLRAVVGR
jgi:eukaryotic-like serine/threonine-protein kinase